MSDNFNREPGRVIGSIGNAVPQPGPLKGGDGGDTSGGDMESRITRLEAQYEQMAKSLEKVETAVGDLKTGQATLLERSTHLATKTFIGVVVGGGVAFLAALIGILKAIN